MNKYLTILILFFSFTASAQIIYTPMSAGGYQMKYLKIDSGFALPFRDTTIGRGINRPGLLVVNTQDSILYIFNGKKWTPAYVDSTGVIGLIKNKVDSVTLSGNNLFYWSNGTGYGSQLNKLDSIYMSTDSVYTCIGGNCTFRYINSGLDSLSFHSASINSDSTQLSLIRPNGTKDTIEVWGDGFVGGSYTLPIASANVLGGIKIGAGINIDSNGVITAGSEIPHLNNIITDSAALIITNTFNWYSIIKPNANYHLLNIELPTVSISGGKLKDGDFEEFVFDKNIDSVVFNTSATSSPTSMKIRAGDYVKFVYSAADSTWYGGGSSGLNTVPVISKSSDPTTMDITSGSSAIYKNTTSGLVYLWANIGGTLYKTQLN